MDNNNNKIDLGIFALDEKNLEFASSFAKAYTKWFFHYAAFYIGDDKTQNLIDYSYKVYYDFFLQITFSVFDITVKPDFYTKSDFCKEKGLTEDTKTTFDKGVLNKAIKDAKKKLITPEIRVTLFSPERETLRKLCFTYCAMYAENNLIRSADESMFDEYNEIYQKKKAEIEKNT